MTLFEDALIELSPSGLKAFWHRLREEDGRDPDPLEPLNWELTLEAAIGIYGENIVNELQGLYIEMEKAGKPFAVLVSILAKRLAKAKPRLNGAEAG